MNKSIFQKPAAWIILFACFIPGPDLDAQFPEFPPGDVTHTMDRDQMMWQLGIRFPTLSPKASDPNVPAGAFPSDQANPEKETRQAIITVTVAGLDPQIITVTQAAGSPDTTGSS